MLSPGTSGGVRVYVRRGSASPYTFSLRLRGDGHGFRGHGEIITHERQLIIAPGIERALGDGVSSHIFAGCPGKLPREYIATHKGCAEAISKCGLRGTIYFGLAGVYGYAHGFGDDGKIITHERQLVVAAAVERALGDGVSSYIFAGCPGQLPREHVAAVKRSAERIGKHGPSVTIVFGLAGIRGNGDCFDDGQRIVRCGRRQYKRVESCHAEGCRYGARRIVAGIPTGTVIAPPRGGGSAGTISPTTRESRLVCAPRQWIPLHFAQQLDEAIHRRLRRDPALVGGGEIGFAGGAKRVNVGGDPGVAQSVPVGRRYL